MRVWRSSRSREFNEAVVTSLLKWRRDAKLIQERHRRNCGYVVASGVCPIVGMLTATRVHNACAPVLQSLEKLERSFAAMGRG